MSKITNIAILAHVDAGKTTLTEQLLYAAGAIRRPGSVDDGTAQTDSLDIERKRGISVRAASTSITCGDTVINIIDTPGHVDFAGEAERALAAVDGVILVISAVEGVQSHTENLWRAAGRLDLPVIVFINKIDRAGSDAAAITADLTRYFGARPVPLTDTQNEGERSCSVRETADVTALCESLADFDDDIAQLYLDGKLPTRAKILSSLAENTRLRRLTPVLCGSAAMGVGIAELLGAVTSLMPGSDGDNIGGGVSGVVFKLEHDSDIGKVAHVRMFGGELKNRDIIAEGELHRTGGHGEQLIGGRGEKITQIRRFNGARYVDTGHIGAGDIAALCGLSDIRVGDIIGEVSERMKNRDSYRLANPFLTVRVAPPTPDKLTPLISALRELDEEEPLLGFRWEPTEREININLTGKIQLEIITALLRERYNIDAVFSPPSVIYKETPKNAGFGSEAYTMPKPCWAVLTLKFEPLPRGCGVTFDRGNVPHNKLFYKYQTHNETSFWQSISQGLFGWEMTDFKCTLVDGEHHTIHTHPLDFFVATPMAVMNTITNCGSILLEPMLRVRISAPENAMGKVISDITMMRGEFDTPVAVGGTFTVDCRLPVAASLDYPVKLASFTGGRALFFSDFDGYREVAPELGAASPHRGIDPRDRSKWILYARGAIQM
ncbi:MAG: translation factor GTPase family protein [Eubacteriales bacterium]